MDKPTQDLSAPLTVNGVPMYPQREWNVCIQCDSAEEAREVRLWFIKRAKEKAWSARDLTKCSCDHNEYCVNCFPPDFRKGGYWEQQEDKAQGENND